MPWIAAFLSKVTPMFKISAYLFLILCLALTMQCQAPADGDDPVPKPGDPFPSSPQLRTKSKIHLVRHGCYGSCPRYSVTVYGSGKVVYEGTEEVRVKGRVKASVSDKIVDGLMLKVNQMDFFAFQTKHGEKCITDGPTASITVSEPGRERQISDECLIGHQIEELETAVDKAAQTQRWIFIDAKQLQREIDEGWDVITHGGEYARQAVEWDDPGGPSRPGKKRCLGRNCGI
jgi:hypothetical protein